MANNRRSIQEAHERFTINMFLQELGHRHRARYQVIEEPNPPEAIITTGRTTSWIEVTTAFLSTGFAKDLYSYATPGETHVNSGDGVYVEPDAQFARNFVDVVRKKLEKKSYETFRDRYGPGYLVVSIQNPHFSRHTALAIQKAWTTAIIKDRGCFRSIYHIRRMYKGYKVELWRPQ